MTILRHRFRWYGSYCLVCGTAAWRANMWPDEPCRPLGQETSTKS